ncbi:wall-associated receptor kinase-like 1 [Gossypium hirsutum]|uniref:Wall-associated receptor kinase-like 1 n=1 Tax=Gossypium hirsutum TaxID=3635 RepID=A0A1U8NSQ1_GOSHI|nr:wall-associated receptor kinase-like 1 [Gossypium hirsutum]
MVMGLRSAVLIMQHMIFLSVILAVIATEAVAYQANHGCRSRCGEVTIPYPFGTSGDCNISENFFITCDISVTPNKAFLNTISIEIVDISLDGICLAAALFLAGVWWLYRKLKKRRKIKRKQEHFKRNGGLLLEKKLSSEEGSVENIKLFTSKELQTATDHYNEKRILGRGGQGVVYKGMLHDGSIVAVKKSKIVDQDHLDPFINEIVILAAVDHRNVVKLLGCCLETEFPLLVYEFIPNGTLYQLMHDQNEEYPRSWDIRIRIAAEVSNAVSYLHSSASVPIFQRYKV